MEDREEVKSAKTRARRKRRTCSTVGRSKLTEDMKNWVKDLEAGQTSLAEKVRAVECDKDKASSYDFSKNRQPSRDGPTGEVPPVLVQTC